MSASPGSPRPRLVIFDAFNTLVRPAAGTESTFALALQALGVRTSPELMARLQMAASGIEHRRWSRSRDTYQTWTKQTLDRIATGPLPALAPNVIPALEQWHQAPMEMFADVSECLATLRSAGITIAVCSNWGWDLATDLAAAALASCADIVVTSASAGYRKPHRDIYDHVLRLAGADPGEAVFVGDNLETDVLGPERVGIPGVLLDRTTLGADGYQCLRSLRDLPGFLGL